MYTELLTLVYPRSSGVARNFKRGGIISTIFEAYFFLVEQIRSCLKNKKSSRGSRGMLPRKNFENLHAVMAFLVLLCLDNFHANFVKIF